MRPVVPSRLTFLHYNVITSVQLDRLSVPLTAITAAWQHTQGALGAIMSTFLPIYSRIFRRKSCDNRFRFDRIMTMSSVCCFWLTVYKCIGFSAAIFMVKQSCVLNGGLNALILCLWLNILCYAYDVIFT